MNSVIQSKILLPFWGFLTLSSLCFGDHLFCKGKAFEFALLVDDLYGNIEITKPLVLRGGTVPVGKYDVEYHPWTGVYIMDVTAYFDVDEWASLEVAKRQLNAQEYSVSIFEKNEDGPGSVTYRTTVSCDTRIDSL